MRRGAEAADTADEGMPARPVSQPGDPLGRPPRPEMSDHTPPPLLRPIVPTRPVKAARTLWMMSFAAGSIAILFAFVSRQDQLERLRELVAGAAPERDPETLDALASLVFWGTLGMLALVIAIAAIVVHAMMRGRGGSRWALLVMLFVSAIVLLLADAFVIAPGDDGLYLRVFLVAQLTLAGAGLVLSLFPGASTWFRAKKKARRLARG